MPSFQTILLQEQKRKRRLLEKLQNKVVQGSFNHQMVSTLIEQNHINVNDLMMVGQQGLTKRFEDLLEVRLSQSSCEFVVDLTVSTPPLRNIWEQRLNDPTIQCISWEDEIDIITPMTEQTKKRLHGLLSTHEGVREIQKWMKTLQNCRREE